jgi:anti-sigma factor RsiW
MSCAELVELVTDYLEGVLPSSERLRFEEHLGGCEGCVIYLEQMRQTVDLAGRLKEDDLPDEAKAALLQAFRDWRASA